MSIDNLRAMYASADKTDREEGMLAYPRYRVVMERLADRYGLSLEVVIAAFVAMSPNNDYFGNLRSLVSVLDGWRKGQAFDQMIISTYRHCGARALAYVKGEASFLGTARGSKIRAFYHNILNPQDKEHVTIDGHIYATWLGNPGLKMKDAIVRGRQRYVEVEDAIKELAEREFLIPCQLQAITWFARKRVLKIRYDPQIYLFSVPGDAWNTLRDLSEIRPYE